MNEGELLLTTAEVGIAIAGFAGLASVIGRSRPDYNPEMDALRLRIMLELSLLVVAFALLPGFLSAIVISADHGRASSAVFGASFVGYNLYVAARYFRSNVRGMDPAWYVISWGLLTIPASLGLLGAAIWLSATAASRMYFVALYCLLVLSGTQFPRLLVSILRTTS